MLHKAIYFSNVQCNADNNRELHVAVKCQTRAIVLQLTMISFVACDTMRYISGFLHFFPDKVLAFYTIMLKNILLYSVSIPSMISSSILD
mgnify:CR=1 FL=1